MRVTLRVDIRKSALVSRCIRIVQRVRHGVNDLQKVEKVDGRSSGRGGGRRHVGSSCAGVQGTRSAADGKNIVDLRQRQLGFELSQPQGGGLLADQPSNEGVC